MKIIIATAVATVLGATVAMAGATKPQDVAFEDGAVAVSVSGTAGDAAVGREVFANRRLGNCLACHVNSDMPELSFHGEVGPPLDGAADRWSEAELRGLVANSKQTFEDTIMPGFYIDTGYFRPLDDFAGIPILNAQQVEDVVAYLLTLKE
ncbi:MAG: sulfur oxidation c-type cytochrome SoxX [Rhodobacteraceae bacterium]|nr:sulfur oxidation c-type cytochrome SoxX [Paracoccaceae bacterium]